MLHIYSEVKQPGFISLFWIYANSIDEDKTTKRRFVKPISDKVVRIHAT